MSVKILTDSASDITLEELRDLDVGLIPMPLLCGEETVIDDKTRPTGYFWERMLQGEQIKTSQPSPEAFIEAFQEATREGDEAVCILISSALSGTFQGAELAKEMIEAEGVHIIDSLEAAASQRLLVYRACLLRDRGLCAGEIARELEAYKPRVGLCACIDTLDYLVRGGRLSKAAGAVGTAVHLKPIIAVSPQGSVEVEHKTIGLKRAVQDLVKLVMSRDIDPAEPLLPIYAYDDANLRRFLQALEEAGFQAPMREPAEIGATIGAYIGPGGFGLAYVEK